MNRLYKNAAVVLLIFIVSAFGAYKLCTRNTSQAAPRAEQCFANSPSEICPTQDFLDTYTQWKQLQGQIQRDNQASAVKQIRQEIDEWTGMRERLQGMVPQGYNYDENSHKLLANKPPAPPASGSPAKNSQSQK